MESIKLLEDNLDTRSELPNTKRTRRPTNRHSPSEANQQVQVLRKEDNRRPIPDLPGRESTYEVVSSSKTDPNIRIVELFGESDTDNEGVDLIQPNSIAACIWSDDLDTSTRGALPKTRTEEEIVSKNYELTLSSTSEKEMTPMEIAMRNIQEDAKREGESMQSQKPNLPDITVNVPTTSYAINLEPVVITANTAQNAVEALPAPESSTISPAQLLPGPVEETPYIESIKLPVKEADSHAINLSEE